MGADQIAVIRPALQELQAARLKGEDWCVTFEVEGTTRWVQLTGSQLNVSWTPEDGDPHSLIALLSDDFPQAELQAHDHEKFATFKVEWNSVEAAVHAIDRLLCEVWALGDDCRLSVELFEF